MLMRLTAPWAFAKQIQVVSLFESGLHRYSYPSMSTARQRRLASKSTKLGSPRLLGEEGGYFRGQTCTFQERTYDSVSCDQTRWDLPLVGVKKGRSGGRARHQQWVPLGVGWARSENTHLEFARLSPTKRRRRVHQKWVDKKEARIE